jgi:hypothetical protein
MTITQSTRELSQFLVNAKIETYASGSDKFVVNSVLTDSHQLEFSKDDFLYRDIYYGGLHFIGMETVFQSGTAIWGMSYYGGIVPESPKAQIAGMPAVLKAALRQVPLDTPFRGPAIFRTSDYVYENDAQGEVNHFHGYEIIHIQGRVIYRLHYSGGMIK